MADYNNMIHKTNYNPAGSVSPVPTSPRSSMQSQSPAYSPVQQYSPVPSAVPVPMQQPMSMGPPMGMSLLSPAPDLNSPAPATPYSVAYGGTSPVPMTPGSVASGVSPAPSQVGSIRSAATGRSQMSKVSTATTSAGSTVEDKKPEVKYVCGDCSHETCINAGDPIRCHSCGHRILYKKRLQAVQQFQAL